MYLAKVYNAPKETLDWNCCNWK